MTSYQQGFLTKCAEAGLPFDLAYGLMKIAIVRRPMQVRTPAPKATRLTAQERQQFVQPGVRDLQTRTGQQGWNNANNQGVFQPGDRSVAQQRFDEEQQQQEYDDGNMDGGFDLDKAMEPQPQPQQDQLPGPQRGKIVGNAEQAARNGNSWAQYGQGLDKNDPRLARMMGAGTGPQQPQEQAQQPQQPQAEQPKKGWWNSMDQAARKKMIADNGLTVKDFNSMDPKERSVMLRNWRAAAGQQTAAQPAGQSAAPAAPTPAAPQATAKPPVYGVDTPDPAAGLDKNVESAASRTAGAASSGVAAAGKATTTVTPTPTGGTLTRTTGHYVPGANNDPALQSAMDRRNAAIAKSQQPVVTGNPATIRHRTAGLR